MKRGPRIPRDRNREIYEFWKANTEFMALREIGQRYGLSAQRIHQIVKAEMQHNTVPVLVSATEHQ